MNISQKTHGCHKTHIDIPQNKSFMRKKYFQCSIKVSDNNAGPFSGISAMRMSNYKVSENMTDMRRVVTFLGLKKRETLAGRSLRRLY